MSVCNKFKIKETIHTIKSTKCNEVCCTEFGVWLLTRTTVHQWKQTWKWKISRCSFSSRWWSQVKSNLCFVWTKRIDPWKITTLLLFIISKYLSSFGISLYSNSKYHIYRSSTYIYGDNLNSSYCSGCDFFLFCFHDNFYSHFSNCTV